VVPSPSTHTHVVFRRKNVTSPTETEGPSAPPSTGAQLPTEPCWPPYLPQLPGTTWPQDSVPFLNKFVICPQVDGTCHETGQPSWATSFHAPLLRGLRKRTIPTERPPLVSEVSANFFFFFLRRGCNVVSVTNPYGRILGFLYLSRYYFFQVAPQLYARG
jgi:hypothetical protein